MTISAYFVCLSLTKGPLRKYIYVAEIKVDNTFMRQLDKYRVDFNQCIINEYN